MKEHIYNFLLGEGIPPNIIGFHHIMNAVEMLCDGKTWRFGGENGVYDRVAKKEGKEHDWRAIERLCRHAKSKAIRYTEMTMKEWLSWATIQCNAYSNRSKE